MGSEMCIRDRGSRDPSMVDTENASVPVWVSIGFALRGMDHNVGMGTRIQRILAASHVVSCIIDSKNLV